MQARKLEPPGLSARDRELHAAAPMPRVITTLSDGYIRRASPAMTLVESEREDGTEVVSAKRLNLTEREQALADRHLAPRQGKHFTNTDASRRQTARIRGGVEWKPFTQTDHEAGMSADARYKARVLETQRRFAPVTDAERADFTHIDLDAPTPHVTVGQAKTADVNAEAHALLADAQERELAQLRARNAARAHALGIDL